MKEIMLQNQTLPMNKSRVQWVDTAKALAIIFVVMGHMGYSEEVRTLIYGFHMPLFFMLSGMFVSTKDNFHQFLLKKMKTLLVPYLCFNVIFLLFDCVIALVSNHDVSIIKPMVGIMGGVRFGYECLGKFWFLPCLFFADLLMYGVLKLHNVCKIVTLIILFTFWGIVYDFTFTSVLPYSIDMALISLSFLFIGKMYFAKFKAGLSTIWIVLLLVIYLIFTYLNYSYMGGRRVDMYESELGNYAYFYTAAITGSLAIIALTQKVKSNKLLQFLGRNTLVIYGLHMIVGVILSYAVAFLFAGSFTEFQTCMVATLKTVVTLILMIPSCLIVNRYFPWMLGKW
jgi:acyltransferase